MQKPNDPKRRTLIRRERKEGAGKQSRFSEQVQKDRLILRDRAEKNDIIVIDRSLLGRKEKISTLLLDMIKPILLTAQDEDEVRGIVTMGIVAWNCGIIKQIQGEKGLQGTLRAFKGKKYSNERKLLEEYIKIKCTQYGQYNDFIADFQLSIEPDGRMNLSVFTTLTDDIAKN